MVYGPVTAPVTALGALGAGGIRIDGALQDSFTGDQVAGLGDFNGDGRDDIATAGPHTDIDPLDEIGSLYIAFGFGASWVVYPGPVAGGVGQPVGPLTPAIRRTGQAAFTIDPPLPAGLTLDPATGAIGGTPQTPAASHAHRDDDRPHGHHGGDHRRAGDGGAAGPARLARRPARRARRRAVAARWR